MSTETGKQLINSDRNKWVHATWGSYKTEPRLLGPVPLNFSLINDFHNRVESHSAATN